MSKPRNRKSPRTVSYGLRSQAWWVLRKNKSMTLAEIMMTICDGTEGNATVNLNTWLRGLLAVGLVSRQREPGSTRHKRGNYRYTLIKDLGPKAPVLRQSLGDVLDPNSGKTMPIKPVNGDGHD